MKPDEKVKHLRDLENNEGWKILQAELDEDIRITEAKLFGEVRLEGNETIEQLQRERIDRLELRNLPENLIRELSEEHVEPDTEVYKD